MRLVVKMVILSVFMLLLTSVEVRSYDVPNISVGLYFSDCVEADSEQSYIIDILVRPNSEVVQLRDGINLTTIPYSVQLDEYYSYNAYDFGGNVQSPQTNFGCHSLYHAESIEGDDFYLVIYNAEGVVLHKELHQMYLQDSDSYYKYNNSFEFDGITIEDIYDAPNENRVLLYKITTVALYVLGSVLLLGLNFIAQKVLMKKYYPDCDGKDYLMIMILITLFYSVSLLSIILWFDFIVLPLLYLFSYLGSVIIYNIFLEKDSKVAQINKLIGVQAYVLLLNVIMIGVLFVLGRIF